ncbi:MIR motif-containing protein [Polychytrium aggregatum]|uniref:MIR motif-containing protein n=1 Tax=Polychytrium aggregatum TaxID=110093 RepID=UPI0022FEF2D6|nr:MIR motif-containing protein [Polychytrium aggregatum]KAI9209795.1 MIR motif-containing protein [Polychytrium aggregatum]
MLAGYITVAVLSVAAVLAAKQPEFVIEEDYRKVTIGSSVKLRHVASHHRLHSHEINYGSGSRQQSVTGFKNGDDPNSYWAVVPAIGDEASLQRGDGIACGSHFRLQHLQTKKYLHSHMHQSPLSNQQEVSAYQGSDTGDNWRVVCVDRSEKYWFRESQVRLQHVDTNKFLSANKGIHFNNPIPGQLEIACSGSQGANEVWATAEGIYFADRNM